MLRRSQPLVEGLRSLHRGTASSPKDFYRNRRRKIFVFIRFAPIEAEAEADTLCDKRPEWVLSTEEALNLLNFFIVEQQKREVFLVQKICLGACCLTILIILSILNVLRVPRDHATPTFSDFKVSVYIAKGECLYR